LVCVVLFSWLHYHLHVPTVSKPGSLKLLGTSGSDTGLYRDCFNFTYIVQCINVPVYVTTSTKFICGPSQSRTQLSPVHFFTFKYVVTRPTDSQLNSTTRTNCCTYTVYLPRMGYKYARNM